jgi:outer membrane receptor protein involved in Fe transport
MRMSWKVLRNLLGVAALVLTLSGAGRAQETPVQSTPEPAAAASPAPEAAEPEPAAPAAEPAHEAAGEPSPEAAAEPTPGLAAPSAAPTGQVPQGGLPTPWGNKPKRRATRTPTPGESEPASQDAKPSPQPAGAGLPQDATQPAPDTATPASAGSEPSPQAAEAPAAEAAPSAPAEPAGEVVPAGTAASEAEPSTQGAEAAEPAAEATAEPTPSVLAPAAGASGLTPQPAEPAGEAPSSETTPQAPAQPAAEVPPEAAAEPAGEVPPQAAEPTAGEVTPTPGAPEPSPPGAEPATAAPAAEASPEATPEPTAYLVTPAAGAPEPTPQPTAPAGEAPPSEASPEATPEPTAYLVTPAAGAPEPTPQPTVSAGEAPPSEASPEATPEPTAYLVTPLATPTDLIPRGLPTPPEEGMPAPEPTPATAEPTASPTAEASPSPTAEASPVETPAVAEAPAGGPAEAAFAAYASMEVVTGEELRRQGALTVSDALQDVTGLDALGGSDRGPFLPDLGLRGTKGIGSLLVTVDGVPAGGPFDPSLTQLFLDDVDRIEVLRGPQATLFGMEAYNGLIRVFTRRSQSGQLAGRLGGGSFSAVYGSIGWARQLGQDTEIRLSASGQTADGWQERTGRSAFGGSLALEHRLAQQGLVQVFLHGYSDEQDWGSPLPFVDGAPLAGFEIDQNYAPGGAVERHRFLGLNVRFRYRLNPWLHIENTLGLASDRRRQIQGSAFELSSDPAVANGAGMFIEPEETRLFEDLRLEADFELFGKHRLSAGAAVTTGKAKGDGRAFEYSVELGAHPQVPDFDTLPLAEPVAVEETRTLAGFYVHDHWTPVERLTLSGGGRFNVTSDRLLVRTDEERRDEREDQGFTGDIAALVRIVQDRKGSLDALSFFASARHNFKPRVSDLESLEFARVFRPEWNDTQEAGLRSRWLDGQLAVDLTAFHTELGNRLVTALGERGALILRHGGKERINGAELSLYWKPRVWRDLSLRAGFAFQDAKFKEATFVTPDGEELDIEGQKIPLVPRSLWNLKLEYSPERGVGGFLAGRGQDKRPLDPTNEDFDGSFAQFDAGVWYDLGWGRLAVVGRNLGDERPIAAGSRFGNEQFYIAPARWVTAEVRLRLR